MINLKCGVLRTVQPPQKRSVFFTNNESMYLEFPHTVFQVVYVWKEDGFVLSSFKTLFSLEYPKKTTHLYGLPLANIDSTMDVCLGVHKPEHEASAEALLKECIHAFWFTRFENASNWFWGALYDDYYDCFLRLGEPWNCCGSKSDASVPLFKQSQ